MSAEVTAKLDMNVEPFRRAIAKAESGWSGFEGKITKGAKSVATAIAPAVKTAGAMAAAVAAAGTAGAVAFGGILSQGLALNSQMEQASITFKAFTKDAKLADEIVGALKKEADSTPFDTGEMVQAGQALISSAKGQREELMKLIKTAEILAALNPEQGLAGAAFALREAEGGDYQSLIERFNVSRNLVKQLKAEGKEGNDLVLAALKNMGAGPELVAGLASSFTGLQSTAAAFFDQVKADLAEPTFQVMKEGMMEFATALSGEEGQNIAEWAKALGKELGESAKVVKENLSQIDWKTLMDQAAAFGRFLGKAAEKAAEAVNWLNQNKGALNEASMATGFGLMNPVRRGTASFAEAGANVYDFLGMEGHAAQARKEAADLRKTADDRDAMLAKVRQETIDRGKKEASTPVSQEDMIRNWLKSRGKSVDNLAEDLALQGEVARRFGTTEEGLEGIRAVGGDHIWANAKQYMAPGSMNSQRMAKSLQALPAGNVVPLVNIQLTEQNQKHSVMTTTGA